MTIGETASFDPQAFTEFEHAAWEEQAADYHSVASSRIEVVESLLDAAEAGPGNRLLDVACGTGVLTQTAAGRGARAIGLDFSASMVAAARRHYPGLDFREGDAGDLPFHEGSFDTVICSFGLLHFPHPDKAISEAFRVLAPAGRYAFTVWSPPERSAFHGLILGAIKAHGDLDVPIPKGPPMFRFGDPEESRRALLATGFRDPSVTEIPFSSEAPTRPGSSTLSTRDSRGRGPSCTRRNRRRAKRSNRPSSRAPAGSKRTARSRYPGRW